METQTGWRWCGRCNNLAYGGFGDGVCFDGAPHNFAGSFAYVVPVNGVPGEAAVDWVWKWCNRCQVLFNVEFGAGLCFDGAQHSHAGSSDYGVRIGAAPEGSQDGWRRCIRCYALTYMGFGPGACWDGERHDGTDSLEYSLAWQPDVPPVPEPPPPAPTITVDESQNSIFVSGEHFTVNGDIRLSFVCGSDVVKFEYNASESGRFNYVVHEFDDECTGGAVTAVDLATNYFALGQVHTRFPKVHRPLPPVLIDRPEQGLEPIE